MRQAIIGTALLSAVVAAVPASAQNPPAAPAVTRTVLAGTKLPDLGVKPVYFCALAVTVPASAASHISTTSDEILYQLAGSTEVGIEGEIKTLATGQAMFIPGGRHASLKSGGDGPSRSLHFLLVADSAPDSPVPTEPASATELFRSPVPVPDLKPGAYDLNLTRVTFPSQMPSNPPHHRSGAALYYILSGTGANTVAGAAAAKGPGAVIYEPSSLVHQWGNPGSEPLTFLAFNINPEGVPAVVMEAAPK
jgi:mannose-6-phosphate isomerase-like protein (cupin superfamily)